MGDGGIGGRGGGGCRRGTAVSAPANTQNRPWKHTAPGQRAAPRHHLPSTNAHGLPSSRRRVPFPAGMRGRDWLGQEKRDSRVRVRVRVRVRAQRGGDGWGGCAGVPTGADCCWTLTSMVGHVTSVAGSTPTLPAIQCTCSGAGPPPECSVRYTTSKPRKHRLRRQRQRREAAASEW